MPDSLAPIFFEQGLPAFEQQQNYRLVFPADNAVLFRLESIDQPGLCFNAVPVTLLDPDYQLQLGSDDLIQLGCEQELPERFLCLAFLAVVNEQISANLRAPIVIHPQNLRGVQAVRSDTAYSHQHPVRRAQETRPC